MLAHRLLTRVDRLWRPSYATAALSNPLTLFQIGGAKNGQDTMFGKRKRRVAISSWKPVSTKADSAEGCYPKQMETQPQAAYYTEGSLVEYQLDETQNDAYSVATDRDNEDGLTTISFVASASTMEQNVASDVSAEKSVLVAPKTEKMSDFAICRNGSQTTESVHQEFVREDLLQDEASGKQAMITTVAEKQSISVHVNASLIRFVRGKGDSTKRQIENETGVKISCPTSKGDCTVVIEGSTLQSVNAASKKIEKVIEQAVHSPSLDYSHFISLPLAIHPGLIEKLNNFQNCILGEANSSQDGNPESESDADNSDNIDNKFEQSGIPKVAVKLEVQDNNKNVELKIGNKGSKTFASRSARSSTLSDMGIEKSLFIKPNTFHLTVLMLKLWNEERIAAATDVLQGVYPKVLDALDHRPISIRLRGLECMRGSHAKARVVYAPVEEIGGEGRLLRACHVMIQAYVEAGLVLEKDARQSLKLHATLMNARHRKRKSTIRRHDFDAGNIFSRFGSEEWGDYLIREAHLSQRFRFDERGYYHCCTSIPFPENTQI